MQIQKEQNIVIRENKETNVVLDGVAGSGKTSIGMHRIAYLLFAYKNNLKNEDCLLFLHIVFCYVGDII